MGTVRAGIEPASPRRENGFLGGRFFGNSCRSGPYPAFQPDSSELLAWASGLPKYWLPGGNRCRRARFSSESEQRPLGLYSRFPVVWDAGMLDRG